VAPGASVVPGATVAPGAPPHGDPAPMPPGRKPPRRRRRWLIAGAAAALVLAGGVAVAYRSGADDRLSVGDGAGWVPLPAEPEAGGPALVASDAAAAPVRDVPPSAGRTTSPDASPAPAPSVPGSARPSKPAPKPSATGRANPAGTNLALAARVTASGSEGDAWRAGYACDGDRSTRWSSAFTEKQWIKVDLGRRWQLTEITLDWEAAYAVGYRVETSLNGRTWHTLWATSSGQGGEVSVDADGAVARYVRMSGTKRSGAYGYSLLEFEVR
jgi:hypothetical protein